MPNSLPVTRRSVLHLPATLLFGETSAAPVVSTPDLPDNLIAEAYEKAARLNVLAAVNARVFPGYWSVCADGRGFGYGNTYPSLDGHQMTDALLWLGQLDVVKANWAYVRSFQRKDGCLPLAILPAQASKDIGPKGHPGVVAPNGGLYRHWVPGNPLAALASPTYIQNADVIFRHTLDGQWLASEIASVNLAADFLASLTTARGGVKGGGYYVERPPRLDYDGVTQSHAMNAFERVAALNRLLGDGKAARRYGSLAHRIRKAFITRFWMRDHFAEYEHPQRGLIGTHGLTDSDWSALAWGAVTLGQQAALWPRLKDEKRFYYGGMPTGITTAPESYEAWEFNYDRMDLAAMGRVWYLESAARSRMGDGAGLVEALRRVCQAGKENGYYWRERYNEKGGYGAQKYCEYPANLIRIVQRFLLGVELRLDGAVTLSPTVPADYWDRGFGQGLVWRDRVLKYRMRRDEVAGSYSGLNSQRVLVRLPGSRQPQNAQVRVGWHRGPARAGGRHDRRDASRFTGRYSLRVRDSIGSRALGRRAPPEEQRSETCADQQEHGWLRQSLDVVDSQYADQWSRFIRYAAMDNTNGGGIAQRGGDAAERCCVRGRVQREKGMLPP